MTTIPENTNCQTSNPTQETSESAIEIERWGVTPSGLADLSGLRVPPHPLSFSRCVAQVYGDALIVMYQQRGETQVTIVPIHRLIGKTKPEKFSSTKKE
jgi:hypothetical protein